MELPECCVEENLSLLLNVSLEEQDLRGLFLFWGFATSGSPGPVPWDPQSWEGSKGTGPKFGICCR